ncbi:MAG: redoxin domain-containing protein [Planctomycetes bacterium]|nr:redoxin domain-containing protein [Planctomycetota bacterium]
MFIRRQTTKVLMCLIAAVGAVAFLFSTNYVNASPNSRPIKVLIVDGFSNHDWRQTTRVIRQILENTGLFNIEVSTTPASPDAPGWNTWRPKFGQYDVVIQNTNNIGKKQFRWPKEVEVALENFVKSGGGLYILHSANNAFSHWKEYDRMIGLGWRRQDTGTALEISADGKIIRIPPGEGKGTSHGPRFDTVVRILNRHPINNGFPERWKTPSLEVYVYARGPAQNLTVLSYACDKTTQKYWPVEWVVRYGKGRIYNSTFGHLWSGEVAPAGIRCIGFQTMLIRAAEWLAAGKVTWSVPADFPTEDTISLQERKPESELYAFKMNDIEGQPVSLSKYREKVLLIVNVASKCGFTKQYAGLQKLYDKYRNQGLVVLGFPANNFGAQEPGTDSEIKNFCTVQFNITFPMFSKISVKGDDIHPLYEYMTNPDKNSHFSGPIQWNFNKFLIGRDGKTVARYPSKTEPLDSKITNAVERELQR